MKPKNINKKSTLRELIGEYFTLLNGSLERENMKIATWSFFISTHGKYDDVVKA